MITDGMRKGVIKEGTRVVEGTSGNTGIGVAMACAVKGFERFICMPQKISTEKEMVMKALGATIIRTPDEAKVDEAESYIGVCHRLRDEGAVHLDQYSNVSNPLGTPFSVVKASAL